MIAAGARDTGLKDTVWICKICKNVIEYKKENK